ncbi:MAG: amidohydrolase family protein [Opitutaceae bacterium]|nr:amidohydrolase family protein [Opitutaceae bacterium]
MKTISASFSAAKARRWFNCGLRISDFGLGNPQSAIRNPKCGRLAGFVLSLVFGVAASANPFIPAAPARAPLLLTGGQVFTVSGPVLPKADILIVDGRIAQIAPAIKPAGGTEIVDVSGRRVYPGLIAAQTQLGLWEIGMLRQTLDVAEIGQINPNARTQTAINPDSELIPVTRANGILTALAVPFSRAASGSRTNLIAGTSTLLRLDGWTSEDITLRASIAMHVYWPAQRLNRDGRLTKSLAAQQKDADAVVRTLDDAFVSAANYARAKAAGTTRDTDLRWEAMLPLLRGEQRVFVHADELKQIRGALAFARKHQLKITIAGGLDAWRVAEDLKAADVPVIVGGIDRLPLRRDDEVEAAYANPARLHAAGVRFCIASSLENPGDDGNQRNLAYHAARAAAHGLPPEMALRAITLSAAELLGVGAELGSIEVGKRATLIVTDGDPLEIPTQVQMAFIDGGKIDLRSRHTQLYEKYQERLKRLKEQRPGVLPATQ